MIHHAGAWRGFDDVESPMLEWATWLTTLRLLESLGYLPPTEYAVQTAANCAHAVSQHLCGYNFLLPDRTTAERAGGINTTPAIAAKVTTRVWTMADLLERMDANFLLRSE